MWNRSGSVMTLAVMSTPLTDTVGMARSYRSMIGVQLSMTSSTAERDVSPMGCAAICRSAGLKASIRPSPFGPSQLSTRPISPAKNTSSAATRQVPAYRPFPTKTCLAAIQKARPLFRRGRGDFFHSPFSIPLRIATRGETAFSFPDRSQEKPHTVAKSSRSKGRHKPMGRPAGTSTPVVVTVIPQRKEAAGVASSAPQAMPPPAASST